MIKSKQQLKQIIEQDCKASGRNPKRINPFDTIGRFLITMRRLDYYSYKKKHNRFYTLLWASYRLKYRQLSLKLGFSIPYTVCQGGLALPHYGTIVINSGAKIGQNCRIQTCVNIGTTYGAKAAPIIGNNVYIGPGAKIIGEITIADGVCIGAGAVVTKSINEPNTTWGGVPAKKIGDNYSHIDLPIIEY